MARAKLLALIWFLVVASLCSLSLPKLSQGQWIDSDILNLLLTLKIDADVQAAITSIQSKQGKRVLILVSHDDQAVALQAMDKLHERMQGLLELSVGDDKNVVAAFKQVAAIYHKHGSGLLSDVDYYTLKDQRGAELVDKALAALYSPVSVVDSSLLQSDPFFLLYRFLESQQGQVNLNFETPWPSLKDNDKHIFVYIGELTGEPFDMGFQGRFIDSFNQWQQSSESGLAVYKTGAIFYANDGVERAKSEISTVGLGSAVGILLLFIAVFRNIRSLIVTLICLGVSVAVAGSVVIAVYSEIHLIALVFGATLLGISIDYSFHFYCEYYFSGRKVRANSVVKKILPALSLGLISSVVAYSSLMWGAFPGLHQIALFSIVGLITAFATVVLLYPVFFKAQGSGSNLGGCVERFIARLPVIGLPFLAKLFVLGMLAGFIGIGITTLQADDDIRLLQPASEQLRAEQRVIEKLMGIDPNQNFFVVKARTLEELLQREEALKDAIYQQDGVSGLAKGAMVSNRLASIKRQQEVVALKRAFAESVEAQAYLSQLGLVGGDIEKPFLTKDTLSKTVLIRQIDPFLFQGNDYYLSMAMLPNLQGADRFHNPEDGIFWVNRVSEFTLVFQQYRDTATKLLLFAVILVLVVMCFRYGVAKGVRATSLPTISCLLTLAILGFGDAVFNVFHLLGLMVVLGLGLDYAVFLTERTHAQGSTLIAVSLSVATTLLAFGLLSLSSTPAVSSFGVVVLLGVLITYFLAMLLARFNYVSIQKS